MKRLIHLGEHIKILAFLSLIILCSCTFGNNGPEEIYKEYKNACDIGDSATSESLLTENALEKGRNNQYGTGVCTYTHDMSNRLATILSDSDEVYQEFVSPQPVVNIAGNTADLEWLDTYCNIVKVTLYNVEGKWKINSWVISLSDGSNICPTFVHKSIP